MSDRQKISRKKGTTSNQSNPSLKPNIRGWNTPSHDSASESHQAISKKSETSQESEITAREQDNQENTSLKESSKESFFEDTNHFHKVSFRPYNRGEPAINNGIEIQKKIIQRQELEEDKEENQDNSEFIQAKETTSETTDKQQKSFELPFEDTKHFHNVSFRPYDRGETPIGDVTEIRKKILQRQKLEEDREENQDNSEFIQAKETTDKQQKSVELPFEDNNHFHNVSFRPYDRGKTPIGDVTEIQKKFLQRQELEEENQENQEETEVVQTKLTVGEPGDKYEQEADATAAKVMAMSDETLQRQTEEETEETQPQQNPNLNPASIKGTEEEIQTKAKGNNIQASSNLENRLGSSKGGGNPLPDNVRDFMEPRFGADFSQVRVHTDSSSVEMNQELSAQAFAHGNDIYYGAGKSPGNDELTAHELTHTIQQTGGVKPKQEIRRQENEEEEDTQTVQAKELANPVNQSNITEEELSETESQTLQPKPTQPLTISSVSPRIQGLLGINITDKIAGFANNIPGFSLLTLILGKNPITDKPVKRNPTNIIRGVLGLVPGGDSFFANLQQSGALNKAFTWFQEKIAILNITWAGIKSLFRKAWNSVSILDPSGSWERIKNIFLAPIKRIKNFAIALGKKVMEFVFEGVMSKVGGGGARVMGIIQGAGKHFTNIIKNPIGFVGNLVAAVRGGFSKFSANIGTHLKNGLTGWLFGALGSAGLTLPAQFDLKGIISIVLQVLGITYERLRKMLAKRIGEPRVAKLEQTFEFLRTIVTGGLTAAWQKITEFVGNLKETVIGGIRQWVQNSVIKAAIVKLISMFNPAGAIVQAVMAIYNTIQFFIERGSQIAALAQSVFSSIGKIAAGNVGGAANYVEQTMARTLPVTISFLARLIGLGGIGGEIKNIIKRIQAPVEKGMNKLAGFIVSKAKGLFKGKKGEGHKDEKGKDKASPNERKEAAKNKFISLMKAKNSMSREEMEGAFVKLKKEFKLSKVKLEGQLSNQKIGFYASPATFLPIKGATIKGQKKGKAAAARPSVKAGDYIKATHYDGPFPTPGKEVVDAFEGRFEGEKTKYNNGHPYPSPKKKKKGSGGTAVNLYEVQAIKPQNLPLYTKKNNSTYLRAGIVEAKSSVTRGAGRSGSGETIFGHFGADEEIIKTGFLNTQYNGGHLVGDQIMDSHQAFNLYEHWNLAPQVRSFNSPVYTGTIENTVTKAINAGATIKYTVKVQYPDNTYQIKPSDLVKNLLPKSDDYRKEVEGAIKHDSSLDSNFTLHRRTPGFWQATAEVVAGGKTINSGNINVRQNVAFENNPVNVQPGVNYQPTAPEQVRYSLETDMGAGAGLQVQTGPTPGNPMKYTGAKKVVETARQQTF